MIESLEAQGLQLAKEKQEYLGLLKQLLIISELNFRSIRSSQWAGFGLPPKVIQPMQISVWEVKPPTQFDVH